MFKDSKVPKKCKNFIRTLTLALGGLNTIDRVQKVNPSIALTPHWCSLCKKEGTSEDNLLTQE